MKRFIFLILILILAVVIISCSSPDNTGSTNNQNSDGDNNNGQSSQDQGQDNAEITPEEEYEPLPEIDAEGFELRFYNYDNSWMTWAVNELTAEEETGELVLDEIFRRNRRIESKYNCVITETTVGNTNDNFRNIIRSGDDLYDIIQLYDEVIAGYYTQGFMHTWEQLPHINLAYPWWLQDANSVFRLNNKQFAAVGAYSLAMYSRGFVLLFNKDMVADLGISENMYNLVREGKWTADKFAEIAKQAVYDLNGDGVMDGNDRYGATTAVKLHFGALVTGAGVKYIDSDEQGNPYFAIPGNAYALDVMQKIFDVHNGTNIYYKIANDVHAGSGDAQVIFGSQQILFVGASTRGIANYRGYEFDIGILPFPKYSEQQEKYYTLTSGTGVSVLPVTLGADRFEKVGLLAEALTRDSYQGALPAYKETTLKTKYARDGDSADMLDIIFDSLTFDLGLSVFPQDTYYVYMENYLKMNDNFASTTEKQEPKVNAAIKKLTEAAETD